MVLDTDILQCVPLCTSIIRAAVPQLFLNDLSLTAIAVSSSIDLEMCASATYDACYGGIQVSSVKGNWWCSMTGPIPVHLMVSGSRSYVRVGVLLFGGSIEIPPVNILNLL